MSAALLVLRTMGGEDISDNCFVPKENRNFVQSWLIRNLWHVVEIMCNDFRAATAIASHNMGNGTGALQSEIAGFNSMSRV